MTNNLQILSLNILTSRYKFIFTIFIYCIIYSFFYLDSNIVFCMKTNDFPTVADSKTSIRPDDVPKLPENKFDSAWFTAEEIERRSRLEEIPRIPIAEAVPVIDGEILFRDSLVFQELRDENIRMRAELETMANRDRKAFVSLQNEYLRVYEENLKLHRDLERKTHTANHMSKKCMDLYHQCKREREARMRLIDVQDVLQDLKEEINSLSDLRQENAKLVTNYKPQPSCEDKSIQTFSEPEIAKALLKSQPKRLRYLK